MENHSIATKYELETVPIGIGGKRMTFYRVGNLEPLIEKIFTDENSKFTDFPVWIKIWEASLVLTDYLLDEVLSEPKRILEIGAGMGITGMFLAAFGHQVTGTDNEDDCLDLLKLNKAHNGLNNLNIRKLDWHEAELAEKFDLICGSEIIYKESAIEPVESLIKTYLKPDGTVYLAHDQQRMNVGKFLEQLSEDLTVEEIAKTFTGKDMARRILIHVIRFA